MHYFAHVKWFMIKKYLTAVNCYYFVCLTWKRQQSSLAIRSCLFCWCGLLCLLLQFTASLLALLSIWLMTLADIKDRSMHMWDSLLCVCTADSVHSRLEDYQQLVLACTVTACCSRQRLPSHSVRYWQRMTVNK